MGLAYAVGGCGNDERQNVQAPTPQATEPEDPNAAHAAAIRNMRVHFDLTGHAHLADVDYRGLYLDFGTPARAKYTHGDWRNDWGEDTSRGERTFTPMGGSANIWFHLKEAGPRTLRLRMKKGTASQVVVYLNGETLRTIDLQDGSPRNYDVPAPAERIRRGENKLRLRAVGGPDGSESALELDAIRVMTNEDAAAPNFVAPSFARSRGEVRLGDGDDAVRDAWSVDPGTSIRFYVQVPRGKSHLSFGLGTAGGGSEARASVHVRPAGGDARELWTGAVTGRWRNQLVSLEPYAGKVVELELRTVGSDRSEIGWSAVQVLVPMPEQPRIPGEARNAVVLTIDTLRASKLRPYNRQSRVRTPALDAFSADATVFENAQAPENWTKPSVASILTSLTPMTHGTKEDASSLPQAALTLGEVYSGAEFDTAAFLANGYVSDRFGFDQGWDHYTNYIREERSTEAETVFGEAARWIEQHKDKRFFVYIQTIDPHVPYDPPNEFLEMYDDSPSAYSGQVSNRRTGILLGEAKGGRITFTQADQRRLEALHDAEISYHDRYFGRFIERLKELGLYEDMIFVVTSDHGEEFNEHGSWGHGHSIFQELLHVPLVVRWPAAESSGDRVPETVSTTDIGPTILEATGLEIPEPFEGRSLLGFMREQAPAGPAVAFSDFLEDRRVIRAGRHKLVVRGNHTWTMFDLESDPGELRELDRDSVDPIALRYTRIHLGQFLGAADRGAWLRGSASGGSGSALPAANSQIDSELCEQLRLLGYIDSRCDDS